MKKLSLIILLILAAFLLCACHMKTADEATADIKDSLFVDFELINTEKSTDECVYTFRDENGIEFHYECRLTRAFPFTTLFSKLWDKCDYAARYVESFKDEIVSILTASGLSYEFGAESYPVIISINSRADVDTAVKAVSDILNVAGEIPMNLNSMVFSACCIRINCLNDSTYNALQTFTYHGSEPFDEEELYKLVLNEYVALVRDGKAERNDLTDSDYVTCPASKMYITYEETDTDDFCFSYYMGEYSMDFFDIMPSKHEYVTAFSFKGMCERFGIPCENTVTGLKWTAGGHEYYSEYSKKHKDMKIYRDNAEICTLPVEALTMYEQSYFCTVTPDDLALMLNCKYKIDYKLGRIYFNAN